MKYAATFLQSGDSDLAVEVILPDTGNELLNILISVVYLVVVLAVFFGIHLIALSLIIGTVVLSYRSTMRITGSDMSRGKLQRVGSAWKRKRSGATDTAPRIGYKQAFLLPPIPDSQPFSGMVGVSYSPSERVHLMEAGFHAFAEKKDAEQHEQQGNVLLEVLLSGHIEDHELGYIATEQRVLQIIPHECSHSSAHDQDTTEHSYSTPSVHRMNTPCQQVAYVLPQFKYRHGESTLQFLCAEHAKEYQRNVLYDVYPLSALQEMMPWIEEERIVVTDNDQFIPTTIPDAPQETTD